MTGGKMDQAKGATKEAVGALTGDERLEREGKIQHAAGDIKEKAGEVAEDDGEGRRQGQVCDQAQLEPKPP